MRVVGSSLDRRAGGGVRAGRGGRVGARCRAGGADVRAVGGGHRTSARPGHAALAAEARRALGALGRVVIPGGPDVRRHRGRDRQRPARARVGGGDGRGRRGPPGRARRPARRRGRGARPRRRRRVPQRGRDPEQRTVETVDGDGTVRYADGSIDAADAVVVAAGVGTADLAAPLGITVPDALEHHARFGFDGPSDSPCHIDGRADGPLSSTYQHRTSAGLWAVGGHLPDEDTAWELAPTRSPGRSREAVVDHVPRHLPHLDPTPVPAELRCTPSRGLGDGVTGPERGPRTPSGCYNLAKLAPGSAR